MGEVGCVNLESLLGCGQRYIVRLSGVGSIYIVPTLRDLRVWAQDTQFLGILIGVCVIDDENLRYLLETGTTR